MAIRHIAPVAHKKRYEKSLFSINKGGKFLEKLKKKTHTIHNSSTCSDKGQTLEKSALGSLYSGQFTLSTQLRKQNDPPQVSALENMP